MKLLRVTNIQRGCIYDGPGVRTTVFLKGCSLNCPWCCNPETLSYEKGWYVNDEKCLARKGVESKFCEHCERNRGGIPIEKCPFGVVEPTSKDFAENELLEILLRDYSLYEETHGGVTFSGGEPLLQAEASLLLLKKLKEKGINIIYETTLVAPIENFLLVAPYIDCLIVDIKLQPQMMLNNKHYHQNLISTRSVWDGQIIYRMVFVEDMLLYKSEILRSLKELTIDEIEILQCHDLAHKKYDRLFMPWVNYSSDEEKSRLFCSFLIESGINAVLLSM